VSIRDETGVLEAYSAWDWDAADFDRAFGRETLPFSHQLSGLPGFTSDAVIDVAGRVPEKWGRPHSGDMPLVLPERVRGIDLTQAEVAQTIGESRNRLIIYSLERIEPYRTLMRHTRERLGRAVGNREGGLCGISLGVLLASPGAVVQSHYDRHHNLLIQLEGTKEITVGSFGSGTADQRVIEQARGNTHDNLTELPPQTRTFRLGPGDGLYIPAYAFHWVHGGSGVSVALSYGFSTPGTQRAPLVYWCNANLRRLGLRPRPPGQSEPLDRAKAYAITKAAGVRDAVVSRLGMRGPAGPASAR
jgi:hypothetical protein